MKDFLMITISVFGGSLFTWFLSRKKSKAETRSIELDNLEKGYDMWKKLVNEKIEILERTIQNLQAEIKTLRSKKNCKSCTYKKAYKPLNKKQDE